MYTLFLKGFGIGFSIAAIVGPISLLCIRSTLAQGQAVGLAIGLGAALADAIYGAIAAFGLTYLSQPLLHYRVYLHIIGGLFLIYLGVSTYCLQPATAQAQLPSRKNLLSYIVGTLLLTLTNPITIISFMAIFASLGITDGNLFGASLMVGGIFSGCMVWWTILTSFLSIFRGKITYNGLRLINKLSGVLITIFGVLAIVSVFYKK